MPEGDSIAKLAAKLRPHLVGREVRTLSLRERGEVPSLVGTTLEAIDTVGKNMLLRLGEKWVIRVHLGMGGRFRWYPGRKPFPRSRASVLIHNDAGIAVCTEAMRAELRKSNDLRLERTLRKLGPDLLATDCDLDRVVALARAGEQERPLAELLLDQRVAAGVGNVFKSEVAFVVGLHPETAVAELSESQLRSVFETAQEMLVANLTPGFRTTTTSRATGVRRPANLSRHWVYRRRGLPCFRCKTAIERRLLGDGARSTYWCPRCQPAPTSP